ncbi:diguanylate cyclase [Paraburkholderia sp. BCC1876]|jgi:FOG: GGDEF domain|uniref:diguanylate cyclase domain-containing protein n=1 Tax=Paraburkholderia sp. BCC1876 TaxID=2676303 RepID=UPI0015907427|nr:diguanylate cyclase [Paraburkholderia sp. BCC1876]
MHRGSERATSSGTISLAQRVIRQIARPYRLSTGDAVSIGTSIGIAFEVNGESFEQLMKRADGALYDTKEAGKGTYCVDAATISTDMPKLD